MLAAAAAGAAGSPRGTARAVIGGATVEIDYGRPWVRGRDLLQWIEPGQLWRLGADAPTTIQSTARLGFGGMLAPPGKHILLVRYIAPGAWSLVISSRPAIEYVPAARIAEALAHFDQRKDPVEQFTIQILALNHHGAIDIAWGRYRLSVPFSIANR
ncbi:MAG: DUF2911 domain-containing protein [Terriglobia bacterium]